jgi:IMP dehydrogenase
MMKQTYSFDDVLLVPKYSNIKSRSEVNISSELGPRRMSLPVISSPMDTVSDTQMAVAMSSSGGLCVLHRYCSIPEQADKVLYIREVTNAKSIAAAIGMSGDYTERADALVKAGANILCIDVAHGHHSMMRDCLSSLKDKYGEKVHSMAGNVATLEAFDQLSEWGADSIRVGIGGGSICSTRIVTGHGVPTLQSIFECAQTSYNTKIIADGGIKTTGDMVKALAAGADFVMVGSMLAGTDETPGELLVNARGEKYKEYRGMASKEAQREWRGHSSTPEGVAAMVPYKGPVKNILENISGGIRSGLSYSGVRSIKELQARARFILQSGAAQLESNTHILWRNK